MPSSPPLILVVDDIAANRDTLLVLLEAENYRPVEAADGREALRLAAESPPDVVLLDVMMPGLDGYEVCRRLRADPRLADVPIVMITALDDEPSRLAGLNAGADDFITKPFNRAELRARMRTITRLNRYRRLVETQEQLWHAQRLENIGMLAAGIAHDFNNALAPLVMGCQLLRLQVADPASQRLLDTMEQSAGRSVGLVRQLLSFARGANSERQLLQLRHVLREVGELAEMTFPKSIRVTTELPRDLWPVHANATQVHQIVLNLCVNARDAMAEGGQLTLRAANRTLDAAAAAGIPGARPGEFLAVEVRDTGTGIPPDVLARIWDPFYTTKGEGKGTGLGLSTVRGILEQYDGFVTVQTEPGRGTTFTIYLPAAKSTEDASPADPNSTQLARGEGELILLAEDEEPLREITARILTEHGYRVVTARDGADAIAVFTPRAAEVRLLLTDSDMPVLAGAPMVAAMRQLKPDLPVVSMSGGGQESDASSKEYTTAFLTKPFQAEALLSIVSRTLSEARSRGSRPPMT